MAGDAVIVAGFGFRAAASAESLADACARACAAIDGGVALQAVATASDKAQSPAFRRLVQQMGIAAIAVDTPQLIAQKTRTQSDASRKARGTGSVAEAAALVAAGSGARLLGVRCISGDGLATCALAEGKIE